MRRLRGGTDGYDDGTVWTALATYLGAQQAPAHLRCYWQSVERAQV
jgi:hypothetical protein